MTLTKQIQGVTVTLDFDLEPGVQEWNLVSESRGGAQESYQGSGYTITLRQHRRDAHCLVEFNLKRDTGEPFHLRRYVVKADASTVGLNWIWRPWHFNQFIEYLGLYPDGVQRTHSRHRQFDEVHRTMADRRIPIAVGIDRTGRTVHAVGLLDQRIETDIRYRALTHYATGLQAKGTVRYEFERPFEGYTLGEVTEHSDGFFVSSGSSWFDTMQAYRALHDESLGRAVRPSPDAAWEPLWMPWGGSKGDWEWGREEALQQDELFEAAQIAADLGIRGMNGWGGWFRDMLPQYYESEAMLWAYPDDVGDFVPVPDKYPDLRAFVRKLQGTGIKVMPWVSPWMAGRGTKFRQQVKHALIEVDLDPSDRWHNEVTSRLCPRHPFTQQYVPELMARLMREYEFDGYCVDMVDSWVLEPCTADHEHNYSSVGLAMADTFERMRAAMDAVNPEAVIEFRTMYSNISNLYNASTHRAPDTGFVSAYDADRRCCVMLRSYVPTGVAVHFDPLWWHRDEKNESVAKMLSTMVVSGVPQLGIDLVNMSAAHRGLIKAWLSFYHEHKEDFRYGQMRPVQNDALFSTIKVERGAKAFVSYGNYPALRVPLSPDAAEIYLFNCTERDELYTILQNVSGSFAATVHNYDLAPIEERTLNAANRSLLVDLPVPQGGYVCIRKDASQQAPTDR